MNRREFFSTPPAGVAALASTRFGWAAQAVDPKVDWKKVRQSTLDRMAIMTLNFQSILKVPDTQAEPESHAGAVRYRRDAGRHLRRPQGGVPALPPRVGRTVVFQGPAQQAGEIEVAGHPDQPGVQRPEHLRAAAPRPVAGDRSHEDVDRSRGHARRAARDDQPGPADPGEQGPQHPDPQGDGRLRQVEEHHRLGGDARRRWRWRTRPRRPGWTGARARRERPRLRRRRARCPRSRSSEPGASERPGTGAPVLPPAGQPGAPAGPPSSGPDTWPLLAEIIKGAGAYSNVDFGGANAPNQEELHRCLKMMHPMTAGSVHTRVNTRWDLATVIRYLEGRARLQGPIHDRDGQRSRRHAARSTTSSSRRWTRRRREVRQV